MAIAKANDKAQIKVMMAEAAQRHQKGEVAHAEVLYRRVLELDPRHFDALHMLAVVAYQTNQMVDALQLFEDARNLNPKDVSMLVNYGAALRKFNRREEAVAIYDEALSLNPKSYEALFNKAQCLFKNANFEEAAALYSRALEIRSDDSDAHASLGNCLRGLGKWREAMLHFEKAITIDPQSTFAYAAMAEVMRTQDWLQASVALFDKALSLNPRDGYVRTQRAFVLLRLGRLKEGWESYDGRFWHAEERVPRRPIPPIYWDGEDLTGKSIVIWTEQGVGDEAWYGGMLPDLIARAKRVILECSPRMAPVFQRSFPTLEIAPWEKQYHPVVPAAGIDYQAAIGSLGRYFRPDLTSFPKHTGYLKADPEKVAQIKARYGRGPLVGISWKSTNKNLGKRKSSELFDWSPLLQIPGVTFVNLQYGDCREELAAVKEKFGVEILNDPHVDSLTDMDTYYAQVAAMDLVISTSNTAVHVAGSLNVPTWLLVPRNGGGLWYWFLGREDSPWYPSLKLFLQTHELSEGEKWTQALMARIAGEFESWLKKQAT